ncbi:fatty acid desaturase family protein [Myxococcus xanthus DK 1622]|uniref:Fatty acid desaturase family protein n=1 Tax=Myxococcus xanthus (strain DK1622) TaxID=246197 RepID=Q1D169_MYXXD|nr:fatty acid desaturase [Myxococcus xanthus]QVW66972.1 fatty acid desaturase [Myxococcus xanthus DZ2]ABF89451.1 fatty acid desaturase family protein [Myxococcus xanthus DK 1622]NOJ55504.1 fatty acid desaturase [Myxococcus xanthus]QPM77905.1 fatty acid desaturase [Myxococcus xanthus]QZZ53106.1 Fatty acid desaturase [Myxococcus xanthus]
MPSDASTVSDSRAQSRDWRARTQRSVVQLVGCVGAYVLLAGASYVFFAQSLVGGVALAVLAGVVLVRVFILQHDCAHRSLFQRPVTNDRVGVVLGMLTLAPHAYWRAMHLVHHSTSGDLDRRGVGDIVTMTAQEYLALKPSQRLRYRLYRHPAVLLGVGPIFQFLLRFRMPGIVAKERRPERRSILVTNLALVAVHLAFLALGDWPRWLVVHLIITQVAAGLGIWLFFVQHQVERPYWVPRAQWSLKGSALQGSSHLVLPRAFEWLFGAINLHHVHHLKPQIPNYLLRGYMEQHGLAEEGVKLGLRDSVRAFRLKVYDEATGRMTGFPPVHAGQARTPLASPPSIEPTGQLGRVLTFSGEER